MGVLPSIQHQDAAVPDVELGKGGKQGATETPFTWNCTLDHVVGPTVHSWKERSLGLDLGDELGKNLPHGVWADDFLIFNTGLAETKLMLQELTDALALGKLSWKPGSMSFLANEAALRSLDPEECKGPSVLDASGNPVFIPRVESMTVLGILAGSKGSTCAALEHRLTASQAHFWARPSQLTCKRTNLRARLLRLYTTVMATFIWGAGGWLLTTGLLCRVESFELSLLRRVIQVPRNVSESWVDYMKRSATIARKYLSDFGIDSLAVRILSRLHGWAGHLPRLPYDSAQNRVLQFRSLTWWLRLQEMGNHWGPRNLFGWRRHRPGKFPRWESQLYRFFPDWVVQASGRSLWRHSLTIFIKRELLLLGARNSSHKAPLLELPGPSPNMINDDTDHLVQPSLLASLNLGGNLWHAPVQQPGRSCQVICLTDSNSVIQQMLGKIPCADPLLRCVRDSAARTLHKLSASLKTPWHKLLACNPCQQNTRATSLATLALRGRHSSDARNPYLKFVHRSRRPLVVRACFAESVSSENLCAFGLCINLQSDPGWVEVFSCSVFLGSCLKNSLCAVQACGCALLALPSLLPSLPALSSE